MSDTPRLVRIVVADDHQIFRDGLKRLLESEAGFQVVGEAADGVEAALVVRESDRLPGQGWWVARRDYAGAWEGPEARKYLDAVQRVAITYWTARAG